MTRPPRSAHDGIKRFQHARLTGPRAQIDSRIDAVRGDIVDIALADRVAASRYVAPVRMIGAPPSQPMQAETDDAGVAVSSLLFGEAFDVFDNQEGWSWGRTAHDGYLGWVRTEGLADPGGVPTYRISARSAPIFAGDGIKASVTTTLPLGALIVACPAGAFLALDGGGFIHGHHARPIDDRPTSPLAVAARFLGAPYVWGGRTPDGVDCSGLVQAALNACGIACPRDSDQQLAALGMPVAFDDRQRGDVVFFPGHVGLLTGPDTLLHANAHWMATVEEPLEDVIERLAAAGTAEPVLGVRRPFWFK